MRASVCALVGLVTAVVCGFSAHAQSICNSSLVSVSGISSGGFFANQFHVAHSASIVGAGVVAAGPYWCSNANAVTALALLDDPDLISLPELYAATQYAEVLLSIDSTRYLQKSKVYLWSGAKDSVVVSPIMQKTLEYYQHYMDSANIKSVFDVPAEHSWVTDDFDHYGASCDTLGSPYINNCNRSMAGEILTHMYGPLNARKAQIEANLKAIDQSVFVPPPFKPVAVGLSDTAYLYTPTTCTQSHSCGLHVAFHGCNQNYEAVGDAFVRHSGFNAWAEANRIVILYPQSAVNVLNPEGCWDWWAYSGLDFATKLGYQIATIKNMIDYFTK